MKSQKLTIKSLLFRVAQCTWGLPQSLCGLLVFLRYRRQPHEMYSGACVTRWPKETSVSLGMFIFLSDNAYTSETDSLEQADERSHLMRLFVHEYGHSIQSLFIGPMYLLAVGLPSILWNQLPVFHRKREREKISYYDVYPEKQANKLGERFLGKPSVGRPLSKKKP